MHAFSESDSAVDDAFDEIPTEMRRIYKEMAKRAFPTGTVLVCAHCGRTQSATTGEIATYLARAWPTCHGATMWIGDPVTN